MKTKITYSIFLAFLLVASELFAQAPGLFNYQAVIRNATTGQALPDTAVDLRFQIFDAQSGGNLVYEETFYGTETNAYGVVNLQIGGSPTTGNLSTISWGASTFWVMIKMKPDNSGSFTDISDDRTQLVSVPFALYAASAPQTTYTAGTGISINGNTISSTVEDTDTDQQQLSVSGNVISLENGGTLTLTVAQTANGNELKINGTTAVTFGDLTPAGTISAYGGGTAPAGWVLCNGAEVSRTGIYANLFAAIGIAYGDGNGANTFNVPDFRGMFLRGADSGSGNDPDVSGRTPNGGGTLDAPGSTQDDELENHNHGYSRSTINFVPAGTTTGNGILFHTVGPPPNYEALISSGGGNETRPKNVYVNYIIKL